MHYLSKADLILAKQTAARPQDLADLDELRRTTSPASLKTEQSIIFAGLTRLPSSESRARAGTKDEAAVHGEVL